ncbi:hypothetical protein [Streptomyces violaceoruber]|uniref:Uncharacterized protein n=1 Tax=Streptomyces violaceoruber TaxID=1935 RepID=A0ACD4WHE4_STRVN|nr:hypothetical protein R2E43_03695 [Streptomyces violaceoruber]
MSTIGLLVGGDPPAQGHTSLPRPATASSSRSIAHRAGAWGRR